MISRELARFVAVVAVAWVGLAMIVAGLWMLALRDAGPDPDVSRSRLAAQLRLQKRRFDRRDSLNAKDRRGVMPAPVGEVESRPMGGRLPHRS